MSGLRFASLGSGSRGNATLIQAGDTCLLLDCGFPARELEKRCEQAGVDAAAIDAILVTHEHGDHIKGVGPTARRFKLPVWMTHGTWRNGKCGDLPKLNLFCSHDEPFTIGDLEIAPFAVPHDAGEPSQFVFSHQQQRLGILTDTGSLTPHMLASLADVDALLLECNHDPDMLANGPYPGYLQARVGGDYGHLSNQQAARLLSRINHQRLRHLVLGHLSEKNNHPDLARQTLLEVSAELESRMTLLKQDGVSEWFCL